MRRPATWEEAIRFRSAFHSYETAVARKVDKTPVGKSGRCGQCQLWKLHFVNLGKPSYVSTRHVTRMPTASNANSTTAVTRSMMTSALVSLCAAVSCRYASSSSS